MKKNASWWVLAFLIGGCTANDASISIRPVLQTTQGLSIGEITHVVFTLNGDSGTTVSKTFTHGDNTWQVKDFSVGEKVQARALVFERGDGAWTTWEGTQTITLGQGENTLAITAEEQGTRTFTLSAEFTGGIPFVGDLSFEATDVMTGFTQKLGAIHESVILPAGRQFRLDADHPDPDKHILIVIEKDTESQELIASLGDKPAIVPLIADITLEEGSTTFTFDPEDLLTDENYFIECHLGGTCDDQPENNWGSCDEPWENILTETQLLIRYGDIPSLCTKISVVIDEILPDEDLDTELAVTWDPAVLLTGNILLNIVAGADIDEGSIVVTQEGSEATICASVDCNGARCTCSIDTTETSLADGAEIDVKGKFKDSDKSFSVPMRFAKLSQPIGSAPRLIGIRTLPQVVPNHLKKVPVGFNIWIPQQPETIYANVPCNIKIKSLNLNDGNTVHALYTGNTISTDADIYQLPMLPLTSSVFTVWKQATIPQLEEGTYALTATVSYATCIGATVSNPTVLSITDRLRINENQKDSFGGTGSLVISVDTGSFPRGLGFTPFNSKGAEALTRSTLISDDTNTVSIGEGISPSIAALVPKKTGSTRLNIGSDDHIDITVKPGAMPVLLTATQLIFVGATSLDTQIINQNIESGIKWNADAANTQLLWDPDTDTVLIVDTEADKVFKSIHTTPRTLTEVIPCTVPTSSTDLIQIKNIIGATIIPAEGTESSKLVLVHNKKDDTSLRFCMMPVDIPLGGLSQTTQGVIIENETTSCWADNKPGVLSYNPWNKRAVFANEKCIYSGKMKYEEDETDDSQTLAHSFGLIENVAIDPHSMEVLLQRNTGNAPAFANFRPIAGTTPAIARTRPTERSSADPYIAAALDTWTGNTVFMHANSVGLQFGTYKTLLSNETPVFTPVNDYTRTANAPIKMQIDSAARSAWIVTGPLYRISLDNLAGVPEDKLTSTDLTNNVMHMALRGPVPTALSPWAAVPGDVVTVLGQGFSTGAKVYVHGIEADVLDATSHTIRFRVPQQLGKLYQTRDAWVTVESFGHMSGPVPKRLKIYPKGPRGIVKRTITSSPYARSADTQAQSPLNIAPPLQTGPTPQIATTLRTDRVAQITSASQITELRWSRDIGILETPQSISINTGMPKNITRVVGLPILAVTNTTNSNNSITFLNQSTYDNVWTSPNFTQEFVIGPLGQSAGIVAYSQDNGAIKLNVYVKGGPTQGTVASIDNTCTLGRSTKVIGITSISAENSSALAISYLENSDNNYSVNVQFMRVTQNDTAWIATCDTPQFTVPLAVNPTPVRFSDSGHLGIAYGNWPQPGQRDTTGLPSVFIFTVDDQVRHAAWIRHPNTILAVDIADDESWISVTDKTGTTIYNVEGPQ